MIIQVISAFIATAAFSILFYLPRKYLILAGMAGAAGWFLYLLLMNLLEDKTYATLCATLVVALVSHILARRNKTPVTMFLIPGIIPLVPGAGMYYIAHSVFNNNIDLAVHYFFETFKIAGAIAFGIFIMDTIFRAIKEKKVREPGK
jgi:uncharacterized membrane protein YjjB (DUF3815 family)